MIVLVVSLLGTFVLCAYFAIRSISITSYTELERRDVEVALDRAENVIDNKVEVISRSAADYAFWDDTYAFVRGDYRTYVDDNFLPDAMKSLGVDFMVIAGSDLPTASGRAVATDNEAIKAWPRHVARIVDMRDSAGTYDPETERGSGVLDTGHGPLLFATAPVMNTDKSKSARAFLMVGRMLDATEIDSLAELAHLDLTTYGSRTDRRLPAAARAGFANGGSDASVLVPSNEQEIAGYREVPGLGGEPVFVLGVTVPRTIHLVGVDALRRLGLTLGVFGSVACALVFAALYLQRREVLQRASAEARLVQQRERLSAMASELTAAEDRERYRLAIELHDRVGQPLAASRMHLAGVVREGTTRDAHEIDIALGLLAEAMRETRVITTELAPPVIYGLGLGAALRWQCDDFEEAHGLHVHLALDPDESGISDQAKMVIFRAVRELLFNVVKHAGTTNAWVSMDAQPGHVELTVVDKGSGFDVESAGDTTAGMGFGLFSIRDRLPHLGGECRVESAPGRGTRVTLRLPRSPH